MSYDVSFTIDTGGEYPASVGDSLNYTYNCAPMFRSALGGEGINSLDGKNAGEELPRLRVAVSHISDPDNVKTYRDMNPDNGWGSHEGARAFLEKILLNAVAHPKSTIRIT